MQSSPIGPLTAIANALHPGGSKPKPSSTTITHHPDSTHTVTHTMGDGSEHPSSGAASSLDGVHDKLQETLGDEPKEPNTVA